MIRAAGEPPFALGELDPQRVEQCWTELAHRDSCLKLTTIVARAYLPTRLSSSGRRFKPVSGRADRSQRAAQQDRNPRRRRVLAVWVDGLSRLRAPARNTGARHGERMLVADLDRCRAGRALDGKSRDSTYSNQRGADEHGRLH